MYKLIVLNFVLMIYINKFLNVASKNINCQTLIPGLIQLTRGIDYYAIDLKPPYLSSNTGFRHSIFDLTCDEQRTWTISENIKQTFDFPDKVLNVSMLGESEPRFQFYHRFNGLGSNFGNYPRAESYKEIVKQLLRMDKYIVEIRWVTSLTEVNFHPNASQSLKLNDDFVEFVSNLSDKYEDNPEMYREFINKFGTHYFTNGQLCGSIYQRSTINREYFYKIGLEIIIQKSMAKFRKNVFNQANSCDPEFESNTETHIYQLGSVNEINRQVEKPENKLLTDLWVCSGSLEPISQLIDNETIRDQVDKANLVYETIGYVQHLQRAVYMANYKLEKSDKLKIKTWEKLLSNPKIKKSELYNIQTWIYFYKIQEAIDRRYLQENIVKINNFLAANEDKYSVKSACKTETIDKITRLQNQDKQLRDLKVNGTEGLLSQKSRPDSEKVLSVLVETAKLLNALETELIDWCATKNYHKLL